LHSASNRFLRPQFTCIPIVMKNLLQVTLELLQYRNSLRCGLESFFFVNKYFLSAALHQRSKTFAHPPSNIAQDLEAVGAWNKKRQTAIPKDTYSFRKTVKCLKFKASNIELLKLLGRIGHEGN